MVHIPSRSLGQPLFIGLCVLASLKIVDVLFLIPDPGIDFGSFYQSALEWREGREPYPVTGIDPPNLTPPVMLIVFTPFTWLSLPAAKAVWSTISLACLGLSVTLSSRFIGLYRRDIFIILFAASPVALSLGLGQVSFLLMLAMTMAWIATKRGRKCLAGFLLGIVCLVKPFYGLFFLWQLWRRDWIGALTLSGVVVTGLLVSLAMVGIEQFVAWLGLLQDISWQAHIYNASIFGITERLFFPIVELPAAMWTPIVVSPLAAIAATMFMIGLVLWLLLRTPKNIDDWFVALSMAGMLLAPLAWIHYLTISATPTITVLMRRHKYLSGAVLVLVVWPYQAFINMHHDLLGTLTVGLWAPGLVALILIATIFAGKKVG